MKQLCISTAIILAFVCACSEDDDPIKPAVTSGIPAAGLIAYYSLNGNANDGSAAGNHGTNYGASSATDRFGTSTGALSFSGSNFVLVDHIPTLPQGATPRTISAWMRTEVDINQVIVEWGTCTPPTYPDASQRSTLMYWDVSDVAFFSQCLNDVPGQKEIRDNVWHHIVATYDGTTLRLYVDASLDASMAIAMNTIGTELRIGKNSSDYEYFHGQIDDVLIYNRALSESEILSLFHYGGW